MRAAPSRWSCRPRRLALLLAPLLLPATLVAAVAGAGAPTASATGARSAHAAPAKYHPLISVATHGTRFATSTSNNWSGYNKGFLEKDTTFSSISGEWTVPTATQHTPGQAEDSATWIGIGGGCVDSTCTVTDSTLVQAGTEQDVAANGVASYSAWWELVPVPSVTASITVNPGDVISCNISAIVPGVWSIVLQDLTDGQSFTETLPYPSTELTAEWINETPLVLGTSGSGLSAMPNLSTVSFSHTTVNGANAALNPAEEVQLVDSSGNPIATPSAPGSAGDSFNDCAWASTCAAP